MSIPPRYLAGFTGKARQERIREILRERKLGTYKPLPSDKGVKTRRSKWSALFERTYGERPRNVSDLARLTGIDRRILKQVYDRGLAAWSTGGHRPGASQHAWADFQRPRSRSGLEGWAGVESGTEDTCPPHLTSTTTESEPQGG